MVSKKDVAKEAGVSATSVSYYLNHNGYVSKESALKIRKAIEKLQYTPNQMARSLKAQDKRQLVFLCNEIRNPFYAELVAGATQTAYEHGYEILFSNIIDDEEYLKKLCGYQVGGLFIPNSKVSTKAIQGIVKMGIPIVMLCDVLWDDSPEGITKVQSAADQVYPEVIASLQKKGYEHFHFLAGGYPGKINANDLKVQAFLNATHGSAREDVSYGITTAKAARTFILEQWKSERRWDAILCANDAVAQGVICALYDQGIRVPEEVGVVGHDNTDLSKFFIPSISTIELCAEEMGKKIILNLIRRLHNEIVSDEIIVPTYIERQSTNRLSVKG